MDTLYTLVSLREGGMDRRKDGFGGGEDVIAEEGRGEERQTRYDWKETEREILVY